MPGMKQKEFEQELTEATERQRSHGSNTDFHGCKETQNLAAEAGITSGVPAG